MLVTAALTIAAPAPWKVLAQTTGGGEGWVLTAPKRRAADAPPAAPPPLPAGADSIAPTTIDIAVSRASKTRRSPPFRQTVSRTAERIHLAGNDGREWLFERNPIDKRRVSATLIEHASKAIVLYEETDLRMALGIRGWADVVALGFDSGVLGQYGRTKDVQTIGGIRFARYAAANNRGPLKDLWWNDDQALPGRFTRSDDSGVTSFAVERARPGTDSRLVRPAIARFPEYRVFDLADWLEKH